MLAVHAPAPPVHHNQLLDYAALCAEAAEAVRVAQEGGRKQSELAVELDVTPPAISRAVREPGPKYASLQGRIIEHLTGYRIEGTFRAVQKE